MPNQIYFNARCKALENKLITKKMLFQMIESKNPEFALKLLIDNKIGNQLIANPLDFEILLNEEKQKFFDFIKILTITEDIKYYFLLPQDFFNAEVIVKYNLTKDDKLKNMLVNNGILDYKFLNECFEKNEYSSLPKPLAFVLNNLNNINSGKEISNMFKKSLYESLSVENKILKEIISTKVDLINIENIFRVKSENEFETIKLSNGTIPNEIFSTLASKDENIILSKCRNCYLFEDIKTILKNIKSDPFTEIEKKIDNIPLEILEKYKYNSDGLIPFFMYAFRFLAQIKNIRIVMVGLLNNLESEEIKSRLRWNYEG